MGTGATKLLVKVGLALLGLVFVFLLLDGEGDGNWGLGLALVWILTGVATLILMTRRRYVRRARLPRRGSDARRLEMRRTDMRANRRPLGGPVQTKHLVDRRD